jgi:hypothetical protein
MGQSSKIPLIIIKNSFSIKLTGKTAEALLQQPRPILWNNDGLYCWISQRRIENIVSNIKDRQKHAESNDMPFSPKFDLAWHNPALTCSWITEMAQAIEEMSQQGNKK